MINLEVKYYYFFSSILSKARENKFVQQSIFEVTRRESTSPSVVK